MSTAVDNIAGKGRNLSTNFWIWALILSLLVFAGNTIWATTKSARLGGASTAASDLQVNSQRLANQGREAVGGKADSFAAFKATKDQIDSDIKLLNDRYGDAAGVSGPIKTVTATWAPLAKSAEQVTASQQAVLGLAGNADRFFDDNPQDAVGGTNPSPVVSGGVAWLVRRMRAWYSYSTIWQEWVKPFGVDMALLSMD